MALTQNRRDSQTHDKDVPIKYQIPLLGLEENLIKELHGKRFLDIGCGKGTLVDYLSSRGIKAEGIDSRSPRKRNFKRKLITGPGKTFGITEEDNSYDFITIFQNPALNSYFTSHAEYMERFRQLSLGNPERWQEICNQAISILLEIGRVLKNGEKAIIYPGFPTLDERAGSLLRVGGIKHYSEAVPKRDTLAYNEWELGFEAKEEDYENYLFMRTVIVKM